MYKRQDYNSQGTLKVIRYKDHYEFSNAGNLKISKEDIFSGGNSKSRNPKIQTILRLIGLGENIGSGFPTILKAWNQQHWRLPQLEENTNLNIVTPVSYTHLMNWIKHNKIVSPKVKKCVYEELKKIKSMDMVNLFFKQCEGYGYTLDKSEIKINMGMDRVSIPCLLYTSRCV